VYGRTTGFPPVFELRSLEPALGGDGSEGFVLAGHDSYDSTGVAVSDTGDVNGDGIADLLIGGYQWYPYSNEPGDSYVVFGRAADPDDAR
jgi:hypothetical protein